MNQPASLTDYLERHRSGKLIELRRQPKWLERRMAEAKGERFVAVKDTSEWRPEPAA